MTCWVDSATCSTLKCAASKPLHFSCRKLLDVSVADTLFWREGLKSAAEPALLHHPPVPVFACACRSAHHPTDVGAASDFTCTPPKVATLCKYHRRLWRQPLDTSAKETVIAEARLLNRKICGSSSAAGTVGGAIADRQLVKRMNRLGWPQEQSPMSSVFNPWLKLRGDNPALQTVNHTALLRV